MNVNVPPGSVAETPGVGGASTRAWDGGAGTRPHADPEAFGHIRSLPPGRGPCWRPASLLRNCEKFLNVLLLLRSLCSLLKQLEWTKALGNFRRRVEDARQVKKHK